MYACNFLLLFSIALLYLIQFYWFHAQVQMEVEAGFVQDVLRGDGITEMRVRFVKKLEDAVPVGEE